MLLYEGMCVIYDLTQSALMRDAALLGPGSYVIAGFGTSLQAVLSLLTLLQGGQQGRVEETAQDIYWTEMLW
jgi:hypothetical protein